MTFDGFDTEAIALLDELPSWSPERYAGEKRRLTEGLLRPAGALIRDVASMVDADLTIVPRRSVSPLHRDLRFAAPGDPRYKDHLLLTAWEGTDKKTSPMFWIRIDAQRAGFASGIGLTSQTRDRWRAAIAADAGAELADVLGALVRDHAAEVAGDQTKRVRAPHHDDHPRADLLRRTGFQVRFVESIPPSLGTPAFAPWCADRLSSLLPVHRWLVAHLT